MLKDYLAPAIQSKFPDMEVRFGSPPDPVAVFPAKNPEVGDLIVWDYQGEAVVNIGEITHGHFDPFEPHQTQEKEDAEVTDSIIGFIEDVFADKYLFYKYRGSGGGGFQHLDYLDEPLTFHPDADYFVWSGRFEHKNSS
jgi:hypothetical protein